MADKIVPDEVVSAVRSGECILFLGSMASAPSPLGCRYEYHRAPPSGGDLAERLAKRCTYPDQDRTNLQRVSLYYQFREGGSRSALVTAIGEEIAAPDIVPSPALHMLAALPFHSVITTNYDHLFDTALRRAKILNDDTIYKDPLIRVYDPELKRPADVIPYKTSEQRPVLLKLHGDLDKTESIVVTEEDYLVFIHKMSDPVNHPIHENLRCRINNFPVLFVGYSLKDYNLRLLFRTLRWHLDVANFPLSFSVDPAPDNLIVSVWQRGTKPMVQFLRTDLWEFVPELYRACIGHDYP